jgi:hypothetical protein
MNQEDKDYLCLMHSLAAMTEDVDCIACFERQRMEESEASLCPEDVGMDEYVHSLERRVKAGQSLSENDLNDLRTIKEKLWQAVATLTTISSTDYSKRMSGANGQVRSALEHVERILRRTKAIDE